MSFAITYTVKNEAALLGPALRYHRALGCSRFYIFWDGTTDSAPSAMSSEVDVFSQNSLQPRDLDSPPEWIREISCVWDADMDVRKRINVYYAARQARLDGIDWLVSIDPDELLLLKNDGVPLPAVGSEFFANISSNIDQVFFRNLEVLPPADHGSDQGIENPFIRCSLFLRRFPTLEYFWRYGSAGTLRITRSSVAQAWFDYLYYFVFLRGKLPRLMESPVTGKKIPCGYFLGYSNHKCAIRVDRASDLNFVVHKWIGDSRTPRNMYSGLVLHYDLSSVDYFSRKFRQRNEHMLLRVFYVRFCLGHIARLLDTDDLREFFNRWIALDRPEVAQHLIRGGIAQRLNGVKQFFENDARDLGLK